MGFVHAVRTMNLLKSLYISAYFTIAYALSAWSLYALRQGLHWGWVGVALTALPPATLLTRALVFRNMARTSARLPVLVLTAVAGLGLASWDATQRGGGTLTLGLATLGVLALLGYDLWYSRLVRPPNGIEVGKALPPFELQETDGRVVTSVELAQAPALLIFYRGNWCPLCMAQIKEIAGMYRELAKGGVQVCMISPQPPGHTAALAKKFDVPFRFLVDGDNTAARGLGIAQDKGIPAGMQVLGYDSETVLPTVLITDAQGTVLWKHETDNYRVRPEPETFIAVFREHGIA